MQAEITDLMGRPGRIWSALLAGMNLHDWLPLNYN